MGVRGLTAFIEKDSSRYLTSTEIKDTCLVIDGNCIASHLFKWGTKRDSCFGGDYDEYYTIVRKFFSTLTDCNIKPIVIFDGGYELKKIKTVIHRLHTKLTTLQVVNKNGYSNIKFFPLFMKHVFWDALKSLKIPCYQTEFEADGELAALARELGCPVLSYDSDFYIYDVLYIPFSTLEYNTFTRSNPQDKSCGVPCNMYNVENFLNQYPGLKKEHLPLLATLLGNDFGSNKEFSNFFNQIPLVNVKNLSFTEKRIRGVLSWLKHESEQSAVIKILSHVRKKYHNVVLSNIEINKRIYRLPSSIKFVDGSLKFDQSSSSLDSYVFELISHCHIPSWVVDMITLHTYFLPVQIEDLSETSSHLFALPVIDVVYDLVSSSKPKNVDQGSISEDALKIYLREKRSLNVIERKSSGKYLMPKIRNGAVLEKITLMHDALNLSDEDRDCVSGFESDHRLYVMCLISWTKCGQPNKSHIYALLASYFVCQARSRTGICKVGKEAIFTERDVAEFSNIFSSYRKTSNDARREYSVTPVHVFNSFQTLLYHTSVLNNLIGYPLQNCKISDSICGTLYYNIYSYLKNKDAEECMRNLLIPAPQVARVFNQFREKLQSYFPSEVRCEFKKKRYKKKRTVKLMSSAGKETSDVEDYNDFNNKFYLLQVYWGFFI